MTNRTRGILACLLLAVIGLAVTVVAHRRLAGIRTEGNDIYFSYVEGQRLLAGQNPYARILDGDMRTNRKYATYFPLFYLLSAATQEAGLREYDQWIRFWQFVFLLADVAIACVVAAALVRRGYAVLGLFAAGFWLLNRWTLQVVLLVHMDFPAILLLLLSLVCFERRRRLSYLLFGASLAFKQIAIFAAPLYVIWAWRSAPPGAGARPRVRAALGAAATVALIPAVVSIPFLIWNAEGFVKSLAFSATRLSIDDFGAPAVGDTLAAWGHPGAGQAARLLMPALFMLIYAAALWSPVGRFTAVLLVMATFIGFNPVLFRQYLSWMMPLIPLVVLDRSDVSLGYLFRERARFGRPSAGF